MTRCWNASPAGDSIAICRVEFNVRISDERGHAADSDIGCAVGEGNPRKRSTSRFIECEQAESQLTARTQVVIFRQRCGMFMDRMSDSLSQTRIMAAPELSGDVREMLTEGLRECRDAANGRGIDCKIADTREVANMDHELHEDRLPAA